MNILILIIILVPLISCGVMIRIWDKKIAEMKERDESKTSQNYS